jgi:hypothetical protein
MSTLVADVPAGTSPGAHVELRSPERLRGQGVLPVLCALTGGVIVRCTVTATAMVDGRTVLVGRGSGHLEGRPIAHKLAVPVELTDLGRALVERPGGADLGLEATVLAGDGRSFAGTALRHVAR